MKKVNKFNALVKKYGTTSIEKIYNFVTGSNSKNSTKLKEVRILTSEIKKETDKGRNWSKQYETVIENVNKSKDNLNESVSKTQHLRKSLKEKYGYETKDKKAILHIIGDKARVKAEDSFDHIKDTKSIKNRFNRRETRAQIVMDIYENGKKKTVSHSLDKSEWTFVKDNDNKKDVLDYLEKSYSKKAKEMYEKLKDYPEINILNIKSVRTL